jgi:hypothetical protein
LYYILSEVGSEFMENPDEPTSVNLQKEQHSNHKTAGNCFPRLRRPRFPSFFKGIPAKEDLTTLSLERENTSLEFDDGDSAFEISPESVLTPIRPSQARKSSVYPSQFRRDQSEQVSLYPSTSRVQRAERGDLGTREEGTMSFLQLAVHEVGESGVVPLHRSRPLGVAFPHPAAKKSLEQDECCLGVHTGHPSWIEREKSNVWDSVFSDPIDDGELSAPPSPIVVETLTANTSWAPLADDPEDSASPEMWKEDSTCRSIQGSICMLANTIGSCSAGDMSSYDVVPFDEVAVAADAPFDEMAIDMERYTDPPLLTMSLLSSDSFVDDFMAPWTEQSRSTNT